LRAPSPLPLRMIVFMTLAIVAAQIPANTRLTGKILLAKKLGRISCR
jgi:hypothetical protein